MEEGGREDEVPAQILMVNMRESVYKNYGEATVPDTSLSSGYELMHEPDFLVLRVGHCMVVPKEKLIQWVEEYTGGAI